MKSRIIRSLILTLTLPPKLCSETLLSRHRHLELWYAVPMAGAVLHTLNIRLFSDHLSYIINHAEDQVIFVDRSLLKSLWAIQGLSFIFFKNQQ